MDARHFTQPLASFSACGVRIARPLGSDLPMHESTSVPSKVTCESCRKLLEGPPWRAIIKIEGGRAVLFCGHLAHVSSAHRQLGKLRRCFGCQRGDES